jgi:anti-sigma-K factor RskA
MTNDPRHDPLDLEQARDLLAPYALGALDAIQREQLESILAGWPEGRRELADLKFAAATLTLIPEQDAAPALGLEGRIIARARAERSDEQRDRMGRRQLTWYRRHVPHSLAAALAVVTIVFGVFAFSSDNTPETGRWLAVDYGDLLLTSETGADPAVPANGRVYVTDYREQPVGVLFHHLQPAPDEQTYQLWFLHEGNLVTSGPTFIVDSDGTGAVSLGTPAGPPVVGFAVSIEQPGGKTGGFPTDGPRFTFLPR